MNRDRAFAVGATIAVIVALVAGFWVLGSPARQRAVSADQVRILRLQQTAEAINRYSSDERYRASGLPRTLAEIDPSELARDPETGKPFDYRPLGAARYDLCATFESKTDDSEQDKLWQHPAGHYCFRRVVSEAVR